jgi:hypothetical protein
MILSITAQFLMLAALVALAVHLVTERDEAYIVAVLLTALAVVASLLALAQFAFGEV